MLPWIFCTVLFILCLIQEIRIRLQKKNLTEICEELDFILGSDTNNLITVSSNEKQIKELAVRLNCQLNLLRKQRNQFLNGDREIKNAIVSLSHDLRTPLTAIHGYLELMEQEEKSDTVEKYLTVIRARTEAMIAMTEELFQYVIVLSADEPEPEEINVNGVVEETMLDYYGALTERGIVPEIFLSKTPLIRKADRSALKRVFSNIINNALKYSDGDLVVKTEDIGTISFSNAAGNLDATQVGRLFDRFYTVENAHHSTGLGLSIARTILHKMGGTIQAKLENGRITIIVELP